MSNLPQLIAEFHPNLMEFTSLIAVQHVGDRTLSGIVLHLGLEGGNEEMWLSEIGSRLKRKDTHTKKINILRPIDKLSIRWNEYGVCDVEVYDGRHSKTLQSKAENCQKG